MLGDVDYANISLVKLLNENYGGIMEGGFTSLVGGLEHDF